MPKLKTNKTASKRFRVTKSGKILRSRGWNSHLRSKQSSAKKRRKGRSANVAKSNRSTVRKMVGR